MTVPYRNIPCINSPFISTIHHNKWLINATGLNRKLYSGSLKWLMCFFYDLDLCCMLLVTRPIFKILMSVWGKHGLMPLCGHESGGEKKSLGPQWYSVSHEYIHAFTVLCFVLLWLYHQFFIHPYYPFTHIPSGFLHQQQLKYKQCHAYESILYNMATSCSVIFGME